MLGMQFSGLSPSQEESLSSMFSCLMYTDLLLLLWSNMVVLVDYLLTFVAVIVCIFVFLGALLLLFCVM